MIFEKCADQCTFLSFPKFQLNPSAYMPFRIQISTDLTSVIIDFFFFFLPVPACHISGITQYMLFYGWLLSFSIMFLTSVLVADP